MSLVFDTDTNVDITFLQLSDNVLWRTCLKAQLAPPQLVQGKHKNLKIAQFWEEKTEGCHFCNM